MLEMIITCFKQSYMEVNSTDCEASSDAKSFPTLKMLRTYNSSFTNP